MGAIVYYSPYGGAVQACILPARGTENPQPEPTLEFQVLQGTLRKTTIPDSHELVVNILNSNEPTRLEGWFVSAEQLYRRGG